jgi:hypothetical protein
VAVSHAVFHIDFSDTAHLTPDFTLSSHMQMQRPQIRALPCISYMYLPPTHVYLAVSITRCFLMFGAHELRRSGQASHDLAPISPPSAILNLRHMHTFPLMRTVNPLSLCARKAEGGVRVDLS